MKKKQELTRKDIFTMLFDIAINGNVYDYHQEAVEEALGPADYEYDCFRGKMKAWGNERLRAREKLFELFIKE